LTEKRKVRAIADKGTAALNEAERQVKIRWREDLRNAYAELREPRNDRQAVSTRAIALARCVNRRAASHRAATDLSHRVRR